MQPAVMFSRKKYTMFKHFSFGMNKNWFFTFPGGKNFIKNAWIINQKNFQSYDCNKFSNQKRGDSTRHLEIRQDFFRLCRNEIQHHIPHSS